MMLCLSLTQGAQPGCVQLSERGCCAAWPSGLGLTIDVVTPQADGSTSNAV